MPGSGSSAGLQGWCATLVGCDTAQRERLFVILDWSQRKGRDRDRLRQPGVWRIEGRQVADAAIQHRMPRMVVQWGCLQQLHAHKQAAQQDSQEQAHGQQAVQQCHGAIVIRSRVARRR